MGNRMTANAGQFKRSLEWRHGCIKSQKICFLPHEALFDGQRERYLVVYPFANMIIGGKLAKQGLFPQFPKGNVLAYCNLRPAINGKRDFRPDILAFTGQGDVLVIEGKLRRKSDGSDGAAVRRLSAAASQLADYATKLRQFAERSRSSPFQSWSEVHQRVYAELHGFPSLNAFIAKGLSLPAEAVQGVVSRVNQSFIEGNVQYGLAFNGPPDLELNVPGYDHIEADEIREVVQVRWDAKHGQLHLFMIDPYKKRYSTFS